MEGGGRGSNQVVTRTSPSSLRTATCGAFTDLLIVPAAALGWPLFCQPPNSLIASINSRQTIDYFPVLWSIWWKQERPFDAPSQPTRKKRPPLKALVDLSTIPGLHLPLSYAKISWAYFIHTQSPPPSLPQIFLWQRRRTKEELGILIVGSIDWDAI